MFDRRVSSRTPGRFATRVMNRGVEATLQVHYRSSKVKQYFKEGRALRTETTINDSRDFGVGRRLTDENWQALLRIGHRTNQPHLPDEIARRSPLARNWRDFEVALNERVKQAALAA